MAQTIQRKFSCGDAEATVALGHRLATTARGGLVLHLSGDLGSGKTTFARGLLRGCGVPDDVTSPSYTLVETYEANGRKFCHLDCYRCKAPTEWLESGLSEPLMDADMSIVEWPEKAAGLPLPDIEVTITLAGPAGSRDILMLARTAPGRKAMAKLR